ncbi:MAG: tRNA preQ1(34) S-adenosylmethionine ribosyltransferase-isomerase QueA [Clostridiales bacterium]|nr:tRNA preQ1(34) S-adenosylmethionine ribosyltransferase-isomerase QueA [Clostridiales bacterium]
MTDISLFDYGLPEELIAQYPADKRDASRLLVVDRVSGGTEDRHFSDLPEYLREGDVLVFNDSKVIKARLLGGKEGTGARIEVFLLKRLEGRGEFWEALAKPAKRLHAGDRILFGEELTAEVIERRDNGCVYVRFSREREFPEVLEQLGHVPLPPYIRREDEEIDAVRYQTVYADEPGSAAAPTAGLHFTDELIERLRAKGVETAFLTLHVGLGTFRPVKTDMIEDHRMHTEHYHISEEARLKINLAKSQGRRIVCVGTTSVRTVESASVWDHEGGRYIPEGNYSGETDIFIYPGGPGFHMTDGLITNFHLPKSTLLMLVCAFYDREKMLSVYREAVEKRYRFFSYGDAMLIL